MTTNSDNALMRQSQILGDKKKGIRPVIPVSPSTWWAGIRSGRFPKPIKLGPKTTCWRAREIYEIAEKGGWK